MSSRSVPLAAALAAVAILCGQPGRAGEPVPIPGYAALVEPDDRLEVWAKPLLDRIAANPGDDAAKRDLLALYQRYGDWKKGLPLAVGLTEANPDDASLLGRRLDLMGDQIDNASMFGKMDLAGELRTLCEETHQRDAKNTAALRCLAEFHMQAPSIVGGDATKVESLLDALEPLDLVQYLMVRADLAFDNKAKDEGAALLAQALPQAKSVNALVGIAVMRLGNQDWPGAFEALEKAAAVEPTSPYMLYQTGRASALSGQRVEQGRDALLRFLQGPAWIHGVNYRPAAHWRLGMLFESLGDRDQAARAYRRALELEPKHKEAKAALKKLGAG